MATKNDRTTRIPSGVASPVTTEHAAKGSVFVNPRNTGDLEICPLTAFGCWQHVLLNDNALHELGQ